MRRFTFTGLAMGVVLALVLAAGCQQATSTPTMVGFETKGLMVAVVPTLTEGAPMESVTLPAATGADDITYGVAPMVPGLAFDSATRVLSGTPTSAGVYPLTYTATSGDDTATLSFTVEVVGSFIGSWASSGNWTDEAGQIAWQWEQVLTFTKSRYILHQAVYPVGSTILDHEWSDSGGWEYTPDTITRVWLDDHDDDDDTPPVRRSVRKDYYWVEGDRGALCVQYWDDDEEEDGGCEVYTRMPRPSAASLLGTWVSSSPRDRLFTFEIEPTSFKFTGEDHDGSDPFVLTGTYELDLEELFLLVTVSEVTFNGESLIPDLPDPDQRWEVGTQTRWAFAPTNSPTKVAISIHWDETNPNPDGPGFVDGEDLPYGDYWVIAEKQ